jgi:hypothetical protein
MRSGIPGRGGGTLLSGAMRNKMTEQQTEWLVGTAGGSLTGIMRLGSRGGGDAA